MKVKAALPEKLDVRPPLIYTIKARAGAGLRSDGCVMKCRQEAILLVDGECNLCNALVRFIVRRDPGGTVRFASLQSGRAQDLLREHGLPASDMNTVVLLESGRVFVRSSAVLHVLRHLTYPWPVLYALRLIPPPWRDKIYDAIARRRYALFGRRDACMVMSGDVRDRFLDHDARDMQPTQLSSDV
jgi:predicted DCC family thiol-disulfide oxidoreductase YuxK